MLSRTDRGVTTSLVSRDPLVVRHRLTGWVCWSWGFCAYFPIGVLYLNLLVLLLAMAIQPQWRQSLRRLAGLPMVVPLALLLGWTVFVAASGTWFPDTDTRLFHMFRVALVLCLGMMLSEAQARLAFAGLLAGSCLAALIVALHHVMGMPDWTLWSSLLQSRNNFSSGNMITMATACGLCVVVALGDTCKPSERWLLLTLAFVLAATVALHAMSRNSQLLLIVLILAGLLHRYRSLRASFAGLAFVAVFVAILWQTSPVTRLRFVDLAANVHAVTTEGNYSTSVGVRWRMYEEAIQGMVAHPVTGTGLGSWLPHWRSVWAELGSTQPPELQAQFADINNPHNDFLLTGMETGVPGMLILAWLLLRYLRYGWNDRRASGGIIMLLTVAIATTAMINAPFRDAALGMTLLWLLGASVALYRSQTHA